MQPKNRIFGVSGTPSLSSAGRAAFLGYPTSTFIFSSTATQGSQLTEEINIFLQSVSVLLKEIYDLPNIP